ncbi:MAG: SlyX family protein [Pseudomonadota bacterium]
MNDTADLETKIAHLERMVDDLSDEVARQAKALNTAERRIAKLLNAAAERELDAGGTIPLADQRPPHW